ncbi:TPM domain-containing protein, partial [Escherichia coli]
THKTRAQVAVLVVPSTGDDSIEQYATRVFDSWKLGDKQRNDGILLLVAREDHAVRIEVGYGLEGVVT